MRKLALSHKILMDVEKPARYIGNETGAVMKDKKQIDIRFAICFPDVYEIGMSHLGIGILYELFNRRADTWCERVYSPWVDLDAIMRKEQILLFALESQDAVKTFDFLGITLQYELCYCNVLQILELSGIPIMANERGEDVPIVIGGGPCAYNPEPLADFFDLFYIGEGEVTYDKLLDEYKANKASGGNRMDFLKRAAKIPGIYVPRFYKDYYNEDGTFARMERTEEEAKPIIERQVVSDFAKVPYSKQPVVPFLKATQDRIVLEIQRGCIRGCRFCQAGMVYRPLRERNVDELKEMAKELLANTGHEEISLCSLSSSDYQHMKELVTYLLELCENDKVNISLPSLRIDAFSLDVMKKVQDVKKGSLTFAPEAGTQRLRDVINKGITKEDILDGAKAAFAGGWQKVKLYFMLGLPTETDDDASGIARLLESVARCYYDETKGNRGKCRITASSSFFIPKPFTPFQWAKMIPAKEYIRRVGVVNDEIKRQPHKKSMRYRWHGAEESVIEGVLARGDRRISKAILKAYERGCLFDAWSEKFDFDAWRLAFDDAALDMDFYNLRERTKEEALPWDFIDVGVSKDFLWNEWEKANNEKVTKNCREKCAGCGAAKFKGGVCYECAD